MTNGPVVGWTLGAGLVVLVGLGLGAARAGRLPVGRELAVASARAIIQLAVISTVIAAVLGSPLLSAVFAVGMFVVASVTCAGRVGVRDSWPWAMVGIAAGAVPVLAVVFGIGVAPLEGAAIVPIAGITIGGTMTAATLTAQRAFGALRADLGLVEAGLSLGLPRPDAIRVVIHPSAPEALTPILDQTRTVGLVTLPGAFVGVILGGGSAADAAAAQVLVLVGLLAAETIAVAVVQRLVAAGRLFPVDVADRLPDR